MPVSIIRSRRNGSLVNGFLKGLKKSFVMLFNNKYTAKTDSEFLPAKHLFRTELKIIPFCLKKRFNKCSLLEVLLNGIRILYSKGYKIVRIIYPP